MVRLSCMRGHPDSGVRKLHVIRQSLNGRLKVTHGAELGSVPNQEFLALILNPQIPSFADILLFSFRVRNSGPKFSTFYGLG